MKFFVVRANVSIFIHRGGPQILNILLRNAGLAFVFANFLITQKFFLGFRISYANQVFHSLRYAYYSGKTLSFALILPRRPSYVFHTLGIALTLHVSGKSALLPISLRRFDTCIHESNILFHADKVPIWILFSSVDMHMLPRRCLLANLWVFVWLILLIPLWLNLTT